MRLFPAIVTSGRRHRTSVVVAIGALFVFAGSSRPNATDLPLKTIAARAFVITDHDVLAPFTFDRVIASLTSAPPEDWLVTLTATQTNSPQQRQIVMPLTGFTPTSETGFWRPAGAPPWSHLRPIAIVNRFDLMPADYRHCGEYRLIFSQRGDGAAKLHIAIEAVLPNPYLDRGKAGCAAVAAFWWELARTESAGERRDQLQQFFFQGLPSFDPAFDRSTFRRNGRIRTSAISNGRPRFRQFEVEHLCAPAQPCAPRLTRVPLDNMPDAALFDTTIPNERAASFRHEFLRHVASLSAPDANRYSMNIDRAYSVSDVDALVPAFNYRLPFQRSLRTEAGLEFRAQIAEELRKAGSTLTPEDVIDRAETQNCAGCHGKPGPVGGGVVFPKAHENGEHISGDPLSERARLSPALEKVFLPYRIDLLRQHLPTIGIVSQPSLHSMP